MEAIVLVGGQGTRLRSVVKDRPKPMAEIGQSPFLQIVLATLRQAEVSKIILAVSYRSAQIMEFFGGEFQGIPLEYSHEPNPLGTGGALKQALGQISGEHCIAMNGDSIFAIDIKAFYQAHLTQKNDFTVASRAVEDTSRYGSISTGPRGIIENFQEKGRSGPGTINGGIYAVRKDTVLQLEEQRFSLEDHLIPELIKQRKVVRAVPSEGYFIDIGIPEHYQKARQELERMIQTK